MHKRGFYNVHKVQFCRDALRHIRDLKAQDNMNHIYLGLIPYLQFLFKKNLNNEKIWQKCILLALNV